MPTVGQNFRHYEGPEDLVVTGADTTTHMDSREEPILKTSIQCGAVDRIESITQALPECTLARLSWYNLSTRGLCLSFVPTACT